MKKLLFLSLIVLLSSCSSTSFYQIYQTQSDIPKATDNNVFFEDKNCKIIYDFWSNGGDSGFIFYNKTDDVITLNLDKSFFVINGVTNDYFQSRVYTKSSTSTKGKSAAFYWYNLKQTANASSSTGFSTSYNEKPTLLIPGKASRRIAEFKINEAYYKNCDLKQFPSKKDIKPIRFDKTTSPIVFYNYIDYSIQGKSNCIQNNFYVSEIKNIRHKDMFEYKKAEDCGKPVYRYVPFSKEQKTSRFFVSYFGLY